MTIARGLVALRRILQLLDHVRARDLDLEAVKDVATRLPEPERHAVARADLVVLGAVARLVAHPADESVLRGFEGLGECVEHLALRSEDDVTHLSARLGPDRRSRRSTRAMHRSR